MMTSVQLATLKTDVQADSALNALPHTADSALVIAATYDLVASPDYWVWRTSVTRADIYDTVDFEGGSWDWTTYKNQSVTEQNAWTQIFMGDRANFAQANVRAGVNAIFTGTGAPAAQRAHCLSVGRRKGTRYEKLFATGAGSTAAPSVMALESPLSPQDVMQAMGW